MSRTTGLSTARQFGTLIGLLALSAVLWALTPHFLTVSNLLNVAQQTSINAVVAVGMTFVILSGGIDLSVGSIVALSGVVLGALLQSGQPIVVAVSAALAIGAATGLVNGALVSWGGLPPFIVTLGMMSVARGAALLFTGGPAGVRVRRGFPLARHRIGRLHSRPRGHHARRLRDRALRADQDHVRPLRLRDRRQRRGDTAVGRPGPPPEDDHLRRVRT